MMFQLLKKSFDLGVNIWFEGGVFIGTASNFSIEIEGRLQQSRQKVNKKI